MYHVQRIECNAMRGNVLYQMFIISNCIVNCNMVVLHYKEMLCIRKKIERTQGLKGESMPMFYYYIL